MPYFSIVFNLTSWKFFGKIRRFFKEIDKQLHRLWLSTESSKEHVQKISRQHYGPQISPKHLIQYTEEIWSIFYQHIVSPKESVTVLIMHYKNTNEMVRSLDEDTDSFNIVAIVLHGDRLLSYLFIIYLDYVLWTSMDRIEKLVLH